jgi:hypothetical protein
MGIYLGRFNSSVTKVSHWQDGYDVDQNADGTFTVEYTLVQDLCLDDGDIWYDAPVTLPDWDAVKAHIIANG